MRDELRALLAELFRLPIESVPENASPDNIRGWDSLAHLQLISILEKRFQMRFALRELQMMDSLERIEAVLLKKK